MNDSERKAAKAALEALEWYVKNDDTNEWCEYNIKLGFVAGKKRAKKAIKKLKKELKEANHIVDSTKMVVQIDNAEVKELRT